MAPLGPLGRILAQGVLATVAILARALPAAYAAALQNARKSGADKAAEQAARQGASFLGKTKIPRDEALFILNLTEKDATVEAIQRQYDRYFEANKVKNGGGSFYLQSKIYRAKELLDEFEKEKNEEGTVDGEEEEKAKKDEESGQK